MIESKLNQPLLQRLAEAGGGQYLEADFRDQDSRRILDLSAIGAGTPTQTQEKTRIWNERFYWLLVPLLLLLLPYFRVVAPGKPSP
ncbi:MAG: hypothetical protein N0C84_18030 [Candidatus Thiodiazotropha taylori]|uniref:Uncharacterized protein n=1 Tax=Candidatus Thiodiazotropha taylori TaxID=2792791 RepID=A0A9E4T4X7_9GAMM|nr:hypothetical protein [Candidatus Thiodiazotropha taylori]MCW4258367.1 hypothetical protein [Candidatus Thiodiazotropha taylori]